MGEDEKLNSTSKFDLARLPPCHSASKRHLQLMNHRVALYKRADESIMETQKPYDDGQGWKRTEDGVLESAWSCGPVLPNPLFALLDIGGREEEDEEEEEEEEEEENATSLALTISVKAVVNDHLTLIVLKHMNG